MDIRFRFMKFRKIAGIASITIFLISVLSLGFRGLSLGLDFSGGTLLEITYETPVSLQSIRSTLEENGYPDSQVVNFGTNLDVLIKVADQNGNSYEFSFVEKISYVDTIYFDTTVTVYGYTFDWDTTIYDTNDFRINFYVDTTGTFNPEPETNYQLSITAPGFELITGSLTTPILPRIDSFIQSGFITDSIIISEPWEIFWDAQELSLIHI